MSRSYRFTQRGTAASIKSFMLLALALIFVQVAGAAVAQEGINPKGPPNDFVQAVGDRALNAVRNDAAAKAGDLKRIDELVDQYLLPYVDFDKTTRLAAGPHWRKATPEQRKALIAAFKGTLLRTYGGALADVDKIASLQTLPFRSDPNAKDVVVRSNFLQRNGPAIAVDYRLENTADGWKIYDINVEGIWLIQTYRTQFNEQVNRNGIQGLIDALNQRNQSGVTAPKAS
ncbi:MAG TPA: ABC transporter substrate-binding protein [Burkholderiaceae bacterium]|nr:ABC transporter substrate-binding protein [Burkholderiaceae bacterium]